jgi:hypothetical protein
MANSGPLCKIPFKYISTTDSWESAYILPIQQNTTFRILLELTAEETTKDEHASFSRSAMFFRKLGTSQELNKWHTIFTDKSNDKFDVGYVLGATDVTFQVKAPNNINTLWNGFIEFERVQ